MEIINEGLVLTNVLVEDSKHVISMLGNALKDAGCVKDSFVSAVLEREGIFPTGLQVGELGVAIPHTDSEHVIEPAIAIATLAKPIVFQSMVDPESPIVVNMVFLLAIKNPNNQVAVLQDLMSIFKDEERMEKILNAKQSGEIIQLLNK